MAQQLKAYFLTDVAAKDRFLKGDKPTEQVFRHLFDSLRFGGDAADTATETRTGLVKRATKALLLSRSAADGSGFKLHVAPDQLPTVEAASNKVTVTPDTTGNYVKYKVDVVPGNLGLNPPSVGAWVPINASGGAEPKFGSSWSGVSVSGSTSAYRDLGNGLIEIVIYANATGTGALVLQLPLALAPSRLVYHPMQIQDPGGTPIRPNNLLIRAVGGSTECSVHHGNVQVGMTILAHILYQKG